MAVDAIDPTDGYPIFKDTGAPDTGVDPTEVAKYAAKRGTRLIGTTAERTAYTHAKKGLGWFDTTNNSEYVYNGTGWEKVSALDTGWVTPTTGSGWGTYAGENVRYRAKNGFVHLSGRVTGTTAAGTLIFTLPAAYRHDAPELMVFNTHSDDGATIILVGSDGKVNIASRAGAHRQGVSLAGISFPIA